MKKLLTKFLVVLSSVMILSFPAHAETVIVGKAAEPVRTEDISAPEMPDVVEIIEPDEEENQEVLQLEAGHWESLGTFKISAYCTCRKCNGNNRKIANDGTPLIPYSTIATDRKVIPSGSRVSIDGSVWEAHDTGSGIKGNRIDICLGSHSEASNWGIQKREVFIWVAD